MIYGFVVRDEDGMIFCGGLSEDGGAYGGEDRRRRRCCG